MNHTAANKHTYTHTIARPVVIVCSQTTTLNLHSQKSQFYDGAKREKAASAILFSMLWLCTCNGFFFGAHISILKTYSKRYTIPLDYILNIVCCISTEPNRSLRIYVTKMIFCVYEFEYRLVIFWCEFGLPKNPSFLVSKNKNKNKTKRKNIATKWLLFRIITSSGPEIELNRICHLPNNRMFCVGCFGYWLFLSCSHEELISLWFLD